MNVTLSLDDALVKKIRKIAVERETTLTGLIRELENATGHGKICMPAPDFLDTNVLLYAYDPSDRRKQLIAHELVRRALVGQS